jgi:hypothetical protein
MMRYYEIRQGDRDAEIDALRHDIERHIAIATEQTNHIADLEAALEAIAKTANEARDHTPQEKSAVRGD